MSNNMGPRRSAHDPLEDMQSARRLAVAGKLSIFILCLSVCIASFFIILPRSEPKPNPSPSPTATPEHGKDEKNGKSSAGSSKTNSPSNSSKSANATGISGNRTRGNGRKGSATMSLDELLAHGTLEQLQDRAAELQSDSEGKKLPEYAVSKDAGKKYREVVQRNKEEKATDAEVDVARKAKEDAESQLNAAVQKRDADSKRINDRIAELKSAKAK